MKNTFITTSKREISALSGCLTCWSSRSVICSSYKQCTELWLDNLTYALFVSVRIQSNVYLVITVLESSKLSGCSRRHWCHWWRAPSLESQILQRNIITAHFVHDRTNVIGAKQHIGLGERSPSTSQSMSLNEVGLDAKVCIFVAVFRHRYVNCAYANERKLRILTSIV